jgi:hypothetical protein
MTHHYSGPPPGGHRYIHADTHFTHSPPCGFTPAVLYGIEAIPQQAYGFHVLLPTPDGGATYRTLPLHALAHDPHPEPDWTAKQAQTWDCYSPAFTTPSYPYLEGLYCKVRAGGQDHYGHLWFTIKPVLDQYSAAPDQAKEFYLVALDNGRFTLQPTNHVLFEELSFTEPLGPCWPRNLKRNTETHSAE